MKNVQVLSAIALALCAGAAANAQVVISQIYGAGGNNGSVYNYDYIELFNRGTTPVDVANWAVQYASATGPSTGTWQVNAITPATLSPGVSSIIQPGHYFLIRVASQNTAVGAPLPITPDAIITSSPINMSATTGKVALTNNATGLTTSTPSSAAIQDLVGFGTANFFEGSGNSPAPSTTTAIRRKNKGCVDSNNNAQDFFVGAPTPRNTLSATWDCATQTATASDLALSVVATPATCNQPSAPGSVNMVFTIANNGPDAATNVQVTFTVAEPSSAVGSFAPASGSITGARPTVTWLVGSLASNASTTLTYSNTLSSSGAIRVSGVASSVDVEDGNSLNDNAAAGVAVADSGGTPKAMIASSIPGATTGSDPVSSYAPIPNQPEGAGNFSGTQFAFGRPFPSPNGQRWVMVTETNFTNTPDATSLVLVGQGDSFRAIAQEGITVFGSAPDNASIKTRSTTSNPFDRVASIDDAGNVLVSFPDNTTDGTNATPKRVVAKGTPGATVNDPYTWTIVAREGDPVSPAVLAAVQALAPATTAVTWGFPMTVAEMEADGGAAFYAKLNKTPNPNSTSHINEVLVRDNGATVLAMESAFTPGNQPVGESYLLQSSTSAGDPDAVDQNTDSNFAARGFISAGTHWKVEGSIGRAASPTVLDTARDQVLIVDGGIVLREGQLLPGFTGADTVAAATSVALTNHSQVLNDGTWYAYGINAVVPPATRPNGWVVKGNPSGVQSVLAKTGQPIRTGTTETWSNQVSSSTFTLVTARGSDYVIGGLTSNFDSSRDVVLVHNGTTEILREGDPINVGTVATPVIVYTHTFIEANRAFIDNNRNLYVVVGTRNANWVCDPVAANLTGQALVKIPLPAVGPVRCNAADVAGLGGAPGADGQNTVDDIVYFLQQFFIPNAAVADIVGLGGAPNPPDGQVTVDDLVYFLNQFFAPCNP